MGGFYLAHLHVQILLGADITRDLEILTFPIHVFSKDRPPLQTTKPGQCRVMS